MKVLEKFVSIEGEGIWQGYPAVFIRFAGCNLSCSFCDTAYAQEYDQGDETRVDSIVDYVLETGIERVTLTGGEPLGRDRIWDLIKLLAFHGKKVNVETNGSQHIPGCLSENVIITMDYKLPSSRMEKKMLISNIPKLRSCDVLKFVCSDLGDLYKASNIIYKYKPKSHIFFSPVYGRIEPKEIVEFLVARKMNNCRVQLQIHKYIWDPEKRCV